MSDERLRALERTWRASGQVADEVAWLLERVRLGLLTQQQLELLSYAGDAAALELTQAPVSRSTSRIPAEAWVLGLLPFKALGSRAACVVALAVESLKKTSMTRAQIEKRAMVRAWIDCPCPQHADAVLEPMTEQGTYASGIVDLAVRRLRRKCIDDVASYVRLAIDDLWLTPEVVLAAMLYAVRGWLLEGTCEDSMGQGSPVPTLFHRRQWLTQNARSLQEPARLGPLPDPCPPADPTLQVNFIEDLVVDATPATSLVRDPRIGNAVLARIESRAVLRLRADRRVWTQDSGPWLHLELLDARVEPGSTIQLQLGLRAGRDDPPSAALSVTIVVTHGQVSVALRGSEGRAEGLDLGQQVWQTKGTVSVDLILGLLDPSGAPSHHLRAGLADRVPGFERHAGQRFVGALPPGIARAFQRVGMTLHVSADNGSGDAATLILAQ